MNRGSKEKRIKFWTAFAKDWLLCVWLSFLGWLWEMLFMLLAYKKFADRGFLSLPICPIYGITIMLAFYLFGTPHRGRYALKRIKPAFWRYAFYLFFAFLLPTVAELIVGLFYHKVYGVRLWNYSNRPLHIGGYVSLPISLSWAVALTLFMRIFFLPMRNFFQSAKTKPAVISASILFVAALADFIYNLCLLVFA